MIVREVLGANTVAMLLNGPPATDWVTKYLTAPGTAFHDTVILVSDTTVAVTPVGAGRTNCSVWLSRSEGSSPRQPLSPHNMPMTTTNDCTRDLVCMIRPR